jgi:hypothetical protein
MKPTYEELQANVIQLRIAATIVLNARDEDGITPSGLLNKFDELSCALSKMPAESLREVVKNAFIAGVNYADEIHFMDAPSCVRLGAENYAIKLLLNTRGE